MKNHVDAVGDVIFDEPKSEVLKKEDLIYIVCVRERVYFFFMSLYVMLSGLIIH